MRLKLWSGLAVALGLVAACGGRVAVQNVNEGTGGSGATGGTGAGGAPQVACDLSLIASGALPRRGQRSVDSAAIAASSKSYTIAYVEEDPSDSTKRNTTLVSLSDSGQLGNVTRDDLAGCAGPAVSRGSAVTFDTSGSAGLAAFALSNCGGSGAGAMFYHLNANGVPASPKIAANPDFTEISFGAHALAPLGPDQFAFVYLPHDVTSPAVNGAALATLSGDAFASGVVALFGAKATDAVGVSASGSVQTIIGHLASGLEVFQIGATPDADAGGPMVALGSQAWGAVTIVGSRVGMLLPTSAGLQYRVFNSYYQQYEHVLASPPTPHGDIATLGHRLIAIGASATALSLWKIDNATGTPGPGVMVPTHLTASSVRPVAIAAARSTVAIVFMGSNDREHWALFSCKD